MVRELRQVLAGPAGRQGLLVFLVARLVLTLWAAFMVVLLPPPAVADEAVRPYVGSPILASGPAGLLLGPWQRFDTMRYLALAGDGYTDQNSVFPPLYPLLIRGVGGLLGLLGVPQAAANLLAALLIANLAALAAFILLHHITSQELDRRAANRALVYLAFFPAGFFLFAGYTESLFLCFALGAVWAMRRARPGLAGLLGLLAALTRLTGAVLVVPLAYEYLRQRGFNWREVRWSGLAVGLPLLGSLAFLGWRMAAGLAPIGQVYQQYWYQVTGLPGRDLLVALGTLVRGTGPRAGEFTLFFDLFCALLLAVTTVLAFRRLGATYGLYSLMMLGFMLLPASDLKPLYSFSRYALAFFPTFMVLADLGHRPWVNRLILYPSLALYLYFSGQFFIWGWVA